MSEQYSPNDGAVPKPPYTTRLLSQRDLGLAVPINFVTTPGVSLSSACFSKLKFDDDEATLCLSNLLAVGFRRFEVDLYWDEVLQVWSLCPVALTQPAPSSSAKPPSSSSSSDTTSRDISSPISSSKVIGRQISSSPESASVSMSSSSFTSMTATSLGESLPSYTAVPDASDNHLVTSGPYTCSTTINVSTFTSLLFDYIQKTENTIAANLLHVIVNIHAVASSATPLLPASKPNVFPSASNLLGVRFSGNLTNYIYTPDLLRDDRENLNNSWYRVSEMYRPPDGYYSTSSSQYGIISTEDGWPSEGYIEFSKSKRLLLGFGTIDPQMQDYNFTADDNTLFPSGYIQSIKSNVIASNDGQLTSGCFFLNGTNNIAQTNSSWALGATLPRFPYPLTSNGDLLPTERLVSNMTSCGVSPLLNTTLLGETAGANFTPYQRYAYSTIWSWGPDEPHNYTTTANTDPTLFRCAMATLPLGNWVVGDCSTKNFAACRAQSQPYNWTLASYPVSYTYASRSCPNGYTFVAPRTALENSYLTRAMKDSRLEFGDKSGPWVNFNSLDLEGCWTTGGANATCQYSDNFDWSDNLHRKQILVPTVAAIIVLIITAMTVFAKAAGNRSRRRVKKKRAHNGFVYEGVPS